MNADVDNFASNGDSVSNFPASAKAWDFRSGVIPDGIEIVGDYEIVPQRDGSTAIMLNSQSYINVLLNAYSSNGKLANNYTVTMDVKLSSLPVESLTLLQTKCKSKCT